MPYLLYWCDTADIISFILYINAKIMYALLSLFRNKNIHTNIYIIGTHKYKISYIDILL
jgi:hypothetical protein